MFKAINVAVHSANSKGCPEPKFFYEFCYCCSAAAAALNPNGIKNILSNGLITFFINNKPTFLNEVRSLPRNPSDCIILEICVFTNIC